jgi:hypothetical protein
VTFSPRWGSHLESRGVGVVSRRDAIAKMDRDEFGDVFRGGRHSRVDHRHPQRRLQLGRRGETPMGLALEGARGDRRDRRVNPDRERRRLERDLDLEEATILARREGETPL